jgi:SAM-dependent methyltransferase
MNKKEWFESWFDSEYYHLLYKHRDDSDARIFIDNVIAHLRLPAYSSVIDVACGKGRHAKLLHQKGMLVTGTDLSANSIAYAKQFEGKGLNFQVNDMRNPLTQQFDVIFNLFTSFGYFRTQKDNLIVLKAFKQMLSDDGCIIIDFFNAHKVIADLVPEEIKQIDNINFQISRYVEDNDVIKKIIVRDNGIAHEFEERVQLLYLHHFMEMCKEAGLTIEDTFGNYHLHPYSELKSERLIVVLKHGNLT